MRAQEAMEAFRDMVKLAAPGRATEYMTDLVLTWLMRTNAFDCRPGSVCEILEVRLGGKRVWG